MQINEFINLLLNEELLTIIEPIFAGLVVVGSIKIAIRIANSDVFPEPRIEAKNVELQDENVSPQEEYDEQPHGFW